jgi:hypothetical protein
MGKKVKLTQEQLSKVVEHIEESKATHNLKAQFQQSAANSGMKEKINFTEDTDLGEHPVMGTDYKPQTPKENEKTTKSFTPATKITESEEGFTLREVGEEIKKVLSGLVNGEQISKTSPIITKLGLKREELMNRLIDFDIINNEDGKINVNSKNIKRNIKHLAQELSEMKLVEAGNFTPDPSHSLDQEPGNQTTRTTTPTQVSESNYNTLYMNNEIAIMKNSGGEFFVFYYSGIDPKDFMEFAEVPMDYIGNDEDGQPDFEYDYDSVEIDGNVINGYVNYHFNDLTKGQGLEGFGNGDDIIKIDSELAAELSRTFPSDKLAEILHIQQNENTTAGGVGGSFVAPMGVISRKIQEALEAKIKELDETLEIEESEEVDENTTTGSVGGSFVQPKIWAKDKNSSVHGKKPMIPGGKILESNQTDTAYPNGGFVELDNCTKLNNNTKAQEGGCSVGAVDNVVKQKKSRNSMISPSLDESLKLQHDKPNNMLIVLSDLEGKDASNETFRNKNVLKQNGFNWNGKAWVIPADKLEIAKRTLSLVNKAEYIINSLEDIEDAVEASGTENKDFLKGKLEQYISDLANATDEVALSAEIRRYLTFFSKFHQYSFYNRILIYIQKPDATKVAGYNTWQKVHRQVQKGATSISILRPQKSNKPNTALSDDETDNQLDVLGQNQDSQIRFVPARVFDVSDTKAIDERGDIPDEPQWWGDNTPSETADKLFDAVTEVARYMGVDVTVDSSKGKEKGYSAGDKINISSDMTGIGKLSTMVHELGHELMHWKEKSIFHIDNGNYQTSALQELQAESVSYVVLKHYGLPTTQHATYLALWKANKERIQKNMEIISKVSQFIIEKIDEVVESGKI